MSVHLLPTSHVEVYETFYCLPDACRPAWVVREDGATLLIVDPRSTRRETVEWSADNLTEVEINAMRAAHGLGPIGSPCPDEWLTDDPVDTYIPPGLMLRDEGAETIAQPRRETA